MVNVEGGAETVLEAAVDVEELVGAAEAAFSLAWLPALFVLRKDCLG